MGKVAKRVRKFLHQGIRRIIFIWILEALEERDNVTEVDVWGGELVSSENYFY